MRLQLAPCLLTIALVASVQACESGSRDGAVGKPMVDQTVDGADGNAGEGFKRVREVGQRTEEKLREQNQ